MADVDFDDFGGYEPTAAAGSGRTQRIINIAGAASSVALVIGLGVWGYKIAVRDVNGVPVMRALAGPMRIAPDDPGGTIAENQGLAVNDIAAEGAASAPSDRLVLAPRVVGLDDSDAAGLSDPAPIEAEAPRIAAAPAAAPPADALPDAGADMAEAVTAVDPVSVPVAEAPAPVDPEAVAIALADAITDGAAPLTPLASQVPEGGMAKSLRPPARPPVRTAAVQPTQAAPAAEGEVVEVQQTAAAPTAPAEVEAAKIKAGTRLVQLGAFDSADQARAEWKKMQGRFPDLLASKSLVVQSADSGGRTFYRLRAHGFDGEDDARRFCTALLAEGAACIPVVQR
ncbi:MAG: SPOR domain-containing protein [Paracoccaceae bacterium]